MEDSYSQREIALAVGISHQSVGRYLRRINDASISLADALALDDDALEELLERGTPGPSPESFAPIDLASVDRELNSKHPPTRAVLWDEYKRDHPDEQCYSYSQFNAEIRRYRKESRLTMHIDHTPGDRCYLDYAGDVVLIYSSPESDEVSFSAAVLVATLPYSTFTGVRATSSQDLLATIEAIEDILVRDFHGVPGRIVPDNMATAVTSPKAKGKPATINATFLEFATHLSSAVDPTRVRRPKDKATVEQMVGLIQREVLTRFRHRRFYSLGELNQALVPEVRRVNDLVVKEYGRSRSDRFMSTEANQLGPLPRHRFSVGIWSSAKVGPNYHIKVDHNYYSVPWHFAHETLRCKLSANTVELYDRTTPVAIHGRATGKGRYVTQEAHMPQAHFRFARSNSFVGLMDQASEIGEYTKAFADVVAKSIGKEGLALASLNLIIDIARRYGPTQTEDAARYALAIGATRAASLESILATNAHGCDCMPEVTPPTPPHENLRGPSYFA